jgi:cytochrome c6
MLLNRGRGGAKPACQKRHREQYPYFIEHNSKSAGTYRAKCAVCHGATGKGDSAAGKSLGVVSFSDPSVAGKSDADLRSVIEKGKNKMPAYGKSLKPEEIQGLVGYLRSLK